MLDIIFPVAQISLPFLFILMNKYNSKGPNLNGKIALVTNGSNGLGQKICISLAQYGCNIIIVGSLPADETLNKLHQYNVKARSFKVDIANQQEIIDLKQDVLSEFEKVDILINNVPVISHETVFGHSNEQIEKLMKSNVRSVKNITNCFLQEMKTRDSGLIMTISSTHGTNAYPFSSDHSFAQFRIMKFMKELKELLKRQNSNGIKLVCFSPKVASLSDDHIEIADYLTSDEYAIMILNRINCGASMISKLKLSMFT